MGCVKAVFETPPKTMSERSFWRKWIVWPNLMWVLKERRRDGKEEKKNEKKKKKTMMVMMLMMMLMMVM